MILVAAAAAAPLAALHRDCFAPADAWDEAAMTALLAMPGCFAATTEAGDGAGGLALGRVAADEAELLTLGVLPAARRHGVARRLLRELSAEAARRGARSLFLEVSTLNGPAQALYRAAGFTEIGRRRRYYPDGSDALVLTRRCVDDPPAGMITPA